MRFPNNPAFAATGTVVFMLFAGTAFAHAHLVKSDPAPNAQVMAPTTITLTFNEALAPAFSKVQLASANGQKVAGSSSLSPDKLSLIDTPAAVLAPGLYTVTWQAVSSDDGHKVEGKFSFTVK